MNEERQRTGPLGVTTTTTKGSPSGVTEVSHRTTETGQPVSSPTPRPSSPLPSSVALTSTLRRLTCRSSSGPYVCKDSESVRWSHVYLTCIDTPPSTLQSYSRRDLHRTLALPGY